MISVIFLLIIASVSNSLVDSDSSLKSGECPKTECGSIESAYQNLEIAEQMIKSAKEKVCTNKQPIGKPKDCEDLLKSGVNENGVYLVWPQNRLISGAISVYCDMKTDGGGWTVIQRRGNFSHEREYFYQDWQTYKKGFGNLKEDFWLGNDIIFALTNQKLYSIRIDLGAFDGSKAYAVYCHFWIDDENNNYTLHVSGYSGNAGDSFSNHSGHPFTTKDKKNDKNFENCAVRWKSGWWFITCHPSNLNGEYIGRVPRVPWQGIMWRTWKDKNESLATTEMKIRKMPNWVK